MEISNESMIEATEKKIEHLNSLLKTEANCIERERIHYCISYQNDTINYCKTEINKRKYGSK